MTVDSPRAPGLGEAAPSRIDGKPGLGVITLAPAGGGVAYLGRLTQRALADLSGTPPVTAELSPRKLGTVTPAEGTRFLLQLAAAQARGATDWWIFNHVGVARAQARLPGFVRRPYALWLCGVEAWEPDPGAGRLAAMRGAALRIAISRHTAARVAETHPQVGPVRVCPLALLPPEPPSGSVDADLLARIGPRAVAIVGRMAAAERYKGHDQLLECWPAVRDRIPGAQLVIVGAGDDADRLRAKAGELGISESTLFTGFVSDATREAILARAAAFAMPSRGEGFGLVYLEAMKLGVPCVGSNADAAREVVADGETGFTVDPEDRDSIAAALVRLLGDAELARRLGDAGRGRYESIYTYERFRARFGAVLGEMFGGRR